MPSPPLGGHGGIHRRSSPLLRSDRDLGHFVGDDGDEPVVLDGITRLSRSQVSRMAADLDGAMDAFPHLAAGPGLAVRVRSADLNRPGVSGD
jgi:hypothetical protein